MEGHPPKGRPKGLTLHVNRRPRLELYREIQEIRARHAEGDADDELPRLPRTRGDCEHGERPCPFVSCRHHLYLDVTQGRGGIRLNFPALEPDEIPETCSLDVADRGGETLQTIGQLLNLTRERVRQVEALALRKATRLRAFRA